MDFRVRDVTIASLLSTSLMAIHYDFSFRGAAIAAAMAAANITTFMIVRRTSDFRPRHDAALLVNAVCPMCLIPNGMVEITSEDGSPYQKGARFCECRACQQCFALTADSESTLIAKRLGKINEFE